MDTSDVKNELSKIVVDKKEEKKDAVAEEASKPITKEHLLAAEAFVQRLLTDKILEYDKIEEGYDKLNKNTKQALGEDFIYAVDDFINSDTLEATLNRFKNYLNKLATSDKVFLDADCGLFAGMLMNLPDKTMVDDDGSEYPIGLQKPEAGQTYYVTGEREEGKGVVYHWGAILMTDASDSVTLEGAVGMHSDFPKLANDSTWKFEMYGTNDANDTFESLNKGYFKDATATENALYESPESKAFYTLRQAAVQLIDGDQTAFENLRKETILLVDKAAWTSRLSGLDKVIDKIKTYRAMNPKSAGAGNLYIEIIGDIKRLYADDLLKKAQDKL